MTDTSAGAESSVPQDVQEPEEITNLHEVPSKERRKALRQAKREENAAKREARRESWQQGLRYAAVAAMRLYSWIKSGPVSSILALALLIFFIIRTAVGSEALTADVVAGFGHPWWTVFTYSIWTPAAAHMVVDVILLLTVGVWIERRTGSLWYAVVGFASAWGGGALSMAATEIIEPIDHQWADFLVSGYISGIASFLVGAALAVSVRLDRLWRQRVQMTVLVVLVVAVGFSGSIDALSAVLSALIGWGLGFALWGKELDRRPLTGTRSEGRVLIALVVAAVSIGSLLALRSGDMAGVLAAASGDLVIEVDEDQVEAVCNTSGLEAQCANLSYILRSSGFAARLMTVMPVLLQLVLAWGLRGGRRAAYWGTLFLQGLTAVIAFGHYLVVAEKIKGWDVAADLVGFNDSGSPTASLIAPIIVPVVLMLLVGANHRLFTVRAAAGTYSRFWAIVGGTAAVALVAFIIVGLIARGTFTPEATFWGLIGDYVIRLLPAPALYLLTPQFQSDSGNLTTFSDWMALAPWIVAVVVLVFTFRRRALPNAIGRTQYKEIVRATDAGTMAWMSTWDGNNFWKSPTRQAAVAYRADGGVGLTVTDPAATPEDLEETMREFAQFCVAQDLVPAFYSVHPRTAEITDQWGWPRLQVAEETVLQLPELAFKGKAFQDVRTALNRAKKEGIEPLWTTWEDCPHDLRHQIVQMSEEWASDKDLPEMGFTLGGVAELDDPEVRILIAVDQNGHLHGATSWMPVYDQGDIIGWTLDFMRRRKDGFRPVMEYMIAQAALWAQQENYEILSLSGAPLAKAQKSGDEDEGSSSAALDFILELLGKGLEPVYGFRSLLRFKAKFKPTYVPVFLTLPDASSLPTVGLAIGHAYLPNMSVKDTAALAKAMRGK